MKQLDFDVSPLASVYGCIILSRASEAGQGVSQDLKSGGLFRQFRKMSFRVPQASNLVYGTWAFWNLVLSTYKIEMDIENFILEV